MVRQWSMHRRLCSEAEFFLYLFAGLPLKRVVATGIAHPRDQRRNLFMWFRAFLEGLNKHTRRLVSRIVFTQGPAGETLLVMGMMRDVARDGAFSREEKVDEPRVPGGAAFAENRDGAGPENEEEKENRTSEDHAEDDLAGRNSSGGGFGGWR